MNSVRLNSLYKRYTPSACKDIEMRKFEFEAKTHFLLGDFLFNMLIRGFYKISFFQIFFMLGTTEELNPTLESDLLKESLEFSDIVREQFIDSYSNLTLKSIGGIKWTTQFCSQVGSSSILFSGRFFINSVLR